MGLVRVSTLQKSKGESPYSTPKEDTMTLRDLIQDGLMLDTRMKNKTANHNILDLEILIDGLPVKDIKLNTINGTQFVCVQSDSGG